MNPTGRPDLAAESRSLVLGPGPIVNFIEVPFTLLGPGPLP